MTKPSGLREALIAIQMPDMFKDDSAPKPVREAVERQVNRQLDAVIASLPEDENGSDTNLYVNGYNWALGQVRSILLSAKSKGGSDE